VIGSDDAGVARRAEALGVDRAALETNPLAGTPARIVDRLGQWRERAGVTRVYLQTLDLGDLGDLGDLDQLELVASEVAPQLG
jgi:alkanesulfonate monooxygenase SsuD/methylene tetrahydromethanopterin reductase-like flavin-dependent oxidoreductase (luciferase family)